MKTDRKPQAEPNSEKLKRVKKPRGSGAKPTPRTNGKKMLTTYEHAPIGIVECSPDGMHINANEEFCRLLGYQRKELMAKGLKDITHEDDYAIDSQLHQQLVEGKIPFYRLEKRYLHKNGESIWAELTRSVVRDAAGNPLHTIGVVLDISDRKHVERVLRESTERLRLATEVAQMFTWELDLKTQIYTFADNFERVLGFSGGLLPKNSMETVQKLSPAEDVQVVLDTFAKAIETHGDLHALQYRMIDPDTGQTVWLEANAKIVYDEMGIPERMFGVTQNITEKKKAQEEILIISRMPEENPNPVMRLTRDGKVIYANSPSASLLKSAEEDTGRTISGKLKASVEETYASGLKKEVEIEQDGKVFTATLAPIPGAGYVNLYGNDITERKQAEKALSESEERLRATFNTSVVGFATLTPQARFIEVNDAFCRIVGYSRDELIQMDCAALTHPDDLASTNEHIAQLIAGEVSSFVLEKIYIRKDGAEIWVQNSVSLTRDVDGKPWHLIAICQDITERKRSEQKVAESARRQEALYQLVDQLHRTNSLEDVFNAALDAILAALQCDRASILLFDDKDVMNFVAWRSLSDGYRRATNGHSPWTTDEKNPVPICMNDVNTADLSDALRAKIKEEGIGALAFIPLLANGKLIGKFMTYYNAPHVFNEEEIDLSMTMARQLAFGVDRKRAEDALAREREVLNRLFETMPVMISMYDPKTNSLQLNAEFERLLGWKTEELSLSSMLESIYPDPDYRAQVIQRMSAAGQNDWVEVQVQTRDGRTLDSIWANISILNDRYIGIGVDITERKRAEVQLRESEEKYRRIVETASEGIWEIDKDTRTVFVNARMAEILGYTVEEMLGRSSFDFIFPEDYPDGERRLESAKRGVPARGNEFRYRRKDGSIVWLMASNTPKIDEQGNFLGAFAMMNDVTDRKRSEEEILHLNLKLQEQVDELNKLLEILPTGVWIGNHDCSVITGNAAAYQMLNLRPGINASVTHPDPELPFAVRMFLNGVEVEPHDAPMQRVARTGEPLSNFEHELIFSNGTRKVIYGSTLPLFDQQGTVRKVIGSYTDFTERKQAEKRLLLLAEISELLRNSEDPNELFYAVSETLGEHLRVKRCLFNEIDIEHDLEIVHRDYVNGVPSVAGVHKISEYSSITTAEIRAGKTIVNNDSKTDARTANVYEQAYEPNGERAYVAVPMMRGHQWVASLWVSDDSPRQWSPEEVSLLEAVAERTWTVIEKLRISEELRAREAELDAIITQTPFMLTRCTRDLRYRFVSRAYAEMIGRTPEELAGKPIVEIMGEEGFTVISPYIERVLQGERVEYESEVSFQGAKRPFLHVIYTPDWDEAGNVIGWFASIVDISERKRTEEALKSSEQRFREIFETAGVSVWLEDFTQVKMAIGDLRAQGVNDFRTYFTEHPDFVQRAIALVRILDVNSETLDLFRARSKEDLLGSLSNVFAYETEQVFVEELTALAEGREMLRAETQVRSLDGKPVSVLFTVHFAPVTDDQSHVVVTLTDITERKRAEEALRIENERFMRFVDSNIVGILIGDAQGRVILANDYYLHLLGVSRQDFVDGKVDWKTFTPSEWLSADERAIQELRQNGVCTPYEKEYIRTDGTRVPVYVANAMLPGPGEEIAAFVIDLTERKRAEEALRESETLYRTIARSIPGGGVYVVDGDMRYLVAEGPVTEAFGLSREMLEGHTVSEVFSGEQQINMVERLKRNFAGETLDYETRNNGRVYWTQHAPLSESIGQVIILTLDITERKQAEEALQQLNLQLENRVQERTAALQAMNKSLQDEIRERRQVELALDESRKRLQLLSQRLVEVQEEERRAIARELHDRVGQSLSALNINLIIMRDQLLPDSLERVAARFSDSMHLVGETITLVRDVMSNLRPSVLDDYGLEAALQSYVDEYKSRYGIKVLLEKPSQSLPRLGPSIEMTFLRIAQEALMNVARHANASQVTLSLRQEADSICMTVQDNGDGIVSWQEANRPGSHGLTIMRERAEAFGGNLRVASVPGKGTQVELSIPLRKDSQNETQKESPE